MTRHFTRDDDLTPAEQAEVLALAADLKRTRHTDAAPVPLRAANGEATSSSDLPSASTPSFAATTPPMIITAAPSR